MNLLKAMVNSGEWDEESAMNEINEMRNAVIEGEDPEELLYEIGLEPDYVFDLL